MKWEHCIKSIDDKTKVTFSFEIDEKKWKKVELESFQRIINTNFKIVNNKVEEMKNIFQKEKEGFEKKWNCKFDDIKNHYIPLHSILAGSKI